MKTSNKILVTLLAIPLFFIAAIPLSLNWKLKHGDFTIARPDENYDTDEYKFPRVKFISLEGIDCMILPSDSMKIQVESQRAELVVLLQQNDTLRISLRNKAGSCPRMRLYVGGIEKISANNSKILLRGTLEPTNARSYSFDLSNSRLQTSTLSEQERLRQFINRLDVTGVKSSIDFSGAMVVEKLALVDIDDFAGDSTVSIKSIEVLYNNKSLVRSSGNKGKTQIIAR